MNRFLLLPKDFVPLVRYAHSMVRSVNYFVRAGATMPYWAPGHEPGS
jgi:hypothetical protein